MKPTRTEVMNKLAHDLSCYWRKTGGTVESPCSCDIYYHVLSMIQIGLVCDDRHKETKVTLRSLNRRHDGALTVGETRTPVAQVLSVIRKHGVEETLRIYPRINENDIRLLGQLLTDIDARGDDRPAIATARDPFRVELCWTDEQNQGQVSVHPRRVPVLSIVGLLKAGETPEVIASEFDLSVEQVIVVSQLYEDIRPNVPVYDA